MKINNDFNKYNEILIHNENSIVGDIIIGKEWNKECFCCKKLIKVSSWIL